jgi:6-pyruvoyltetrahydropterin/6-carboxytetrahydropterin synthase
MYKIKIITNFSAAHFLREYKGKCENLHGHNWKIEAHVGGKTLDVAGMVMDFSDLKVIVNKIVDTFDHKQINDIDYFKEHNPSSEEIARFIFNRLEDEISKFNCKVLEISVWETDSSCASFFGENT